MMRRRALHEVLPLDPTAWPVLLAAHREELRTTMAEQAATHRVDLSTMKAPGAQVREAPTPMSPFHRRAVNEGPWAKTTRGKCMRLDMSWAVSLSMGCSANTVSLYERAAINIPGGH
jgi:hypothetical protein